MPTEFWSPLFVFHDNPFNGFRVVILGETVEMMKLIAAKELLVVLNFVYQLMHFYIQ